MKITKATIKSFINKNRANLFINVKSEFDGMIDGCSSCSDGFRAAKSSDLCKDNTLNVNGLWLVNGSRDYFKPYEDANFKGIEYSNCCGYGVVAIKK